jgi:GTP-binding protein
VSAAHGHGTGDLLDKVLEYLPDDYENEEENDTVKVAVIGKPNAGKSSLINKIAGEERVIVSNIEGTTRDSIDTHFTRDEQNYVVIDTAGLKKRGKIYESVDKYAALRALAAIDRSQVVLLVIDANEGITQQDKHVVGYAMDESKAIVIVVNKWDLVEHTQNAMTEFTKKIRSEFKFLDYAPVVYISAKDKSRIQTIFPEIQAAFSAYNYRVGTSVLNDIMMDAQIVNPTPVFNGGRLKIYFASQVAICPPTFVLSVNDPEYMHFSYQRYLENRLRDSFDFTGTPIKIICRARK